MTDKNKLHDVYLGLGSNLGDKSGNINRAIDEIRKQIGNIVARSAFYITEPVGFESANQFCNAACKVQTKLEPLGVLEVTQEIEKELGRKSKSENSVYADRVIDIDILLFDNQVVQCPHLIIPHPRLHERLFVLLPLAEIAGNVEHPLLHKTINELKSELA